MTTPPVTRTCARPGCTATFRGNRATCADHRNCIRCGRDARGRPELCESCHRYDLCRTSEASHMLDGLVDRGWNLAGLAKHFGHTPNNVRSWRYRAAGPPAQLRKLWDEWRHYPPVVDMLTELTERGWATAEIARRIHAHHGTVHAWVTGRKSCSQPAVVPNIHKLWASGELPVVLTRSERRTYRSSPPPEAWDPDLTRPCRLNPAMWDPDATVEERTYAGNQCLSCPVLAACRAALEQDLRDGIHVSGVIAGQWVPWRPREDVA